MVQSPVYGFSTTISALQNLWAKSKADISVPFSSQSHDVLVYIIFTSVLYLFLLGVLKQPKWPPLKEERVTCIQRLLYMRKLHRVSNLSCEHTPLLSQITFLFFQLGSSQDEKCSVSLEQTFVDSCLTPTIAR